MIPTPDKSEHDAPVTAAVTGAAPPAWQRLAGFLALRRGVVGLLAMIVLVGLGERLADRFIPRYLQALGGGALVVGLFGGLKNLATALYSMPGGYLSDHLGTKRALLIFNLMAIVGYLLATMELLAHVLPKTKHTMGVTMLSLVRRFPMALGPVLGGLFIQHFGWQLGVRFSFVVALSMALVGRWAAHLFHGQLRHAAIRQAPAVSGEYFWGWLLHYLVGIAFAALLASLAGMSWLRNPSLLPAVAVGVTTAVVPLFVMQPAMGAGFAASKTPDPLQNCLRSVAGCR